MPVNCVECSYDLTGTPEHGRCPECGLSAGPSYQRARAAGRPIHPLGRAALAVCGAGVLSVAALFARYLMVDPTQVFFLVIGVVWNASPFIALGWMASLVGSDRWPAVAALIASVCLAAYMWWWYIVLLRATDPLAGMILAFMPGMAWIGVAIALLAGAWYLKRKR